MSELYELPDGWEWKELKDVCKFENGDRGKNYPSKSAFVDNGIAVISAKDLNGWSIDMEKLNYINEDRYNLLGGGKIKKDDILFCLRGSLGKCGLVNNLEKGIIASSLVIVRANKELLNGLLLYYFNSEIVADLINKYNNGSAQPNLSSKNLSLFDFPLPPLSEQKKIVAKLDTLFKKIDKAIELHQQNIDGIDGFMASVLNEVFLELEEKYPIKTLNDVFLIQRGGSPRPIKEYITDDKDGINWIKISDATKGDGKYIELTAQKIKQSGLIKSRLVVEGDFIMSNSMSFGRPYIVKTKGAIHDGWLLMREKMKNIDKDYFYHLLSSVYMYQQFSDKASGTTVKNLNIDLVKSSNVILPPLNIQQKTVKYLDEVSQNIEKLKALQIEKKESLKALKASILDRAFRGEL